MYVIRQYLHTSTSVISYYMFVIIFLAFEHVFYIIYMGCDREQANKLILSYLRHIRTYICEYYIYVTFQTSMYVGRLYEKFEINLEQLIENFVYKIISSQTNSSVTHTPWGAKFLWIRPRYIINTGFHKNDSIAVSTVGMRTEIYFRDENQISPKRRFYKSTNIRSASRARGLESAW